MITALVDYLAMFCQAGNVEQMEMIARSMLAAIPGDLVALQFLGLALYQRGHVDDAYRTFKQVADDMERQEEWDGQSVCEPASVVTLRVATQAHSGLSEGWNRIALILNKFGLHKSADRALEAALASRGLRTERSCDDGVLATPNLYHDAAADVGGGL